jgi:hypothetical protein
MGGKIVHIEISKHDTEGIYDNTLQIHYATRQWTVQISESHSYRKITGQTRSCREVIHDGQAICIRPVEEVTSLGYE